MLHAGLINPNAGSLNGSLGKGQIAYVEAGRATTNSKARALLCQPITAAATQWKIELQQLR